jgi:phage gp36-like protein
VQLTNEDPTENAINTSFIDQALADASAEIDGYLDGRFALPLTDAPAVLNRLACDVAIYRLQSLRPIHDMADARQRYEDAVQLLVRVARGEVTLGLTADNLEPAEGKDEIAVEEGSVGMPNRIFSRHTLRSY